jgi:hypothetical protein
MRKTGSMLLLLSLCLGVAGSSRAEDSAQAIIDKAIQAHGGLEKLTSLKAVQAAAKGTMDVMGQDVPFTAETYAQFPNQFKTVIEITIGGMKITQVQRMNKDKIEITVNGMLQPLNDKLRDEMKEQVHAEYVASLTPLKDKDKGYTLTSLAESKVNDRPVFGVKVSSKGHRDVSLYFDKENGLLVRSVHSATDPMSGQEYAQETIHSNYKDFNGIKRPTKEIVNRDGKKMAEVELTDIKNLEKLDDKVFEP